MMTSEKGERAVCEGPPGPWGGEDFDFYSEVRPQEGSEQVRALIWLRCSQEPCGCMLWVWETDCERWGGSRKTGG